MNKQRIIVTCPDTGVLAITPLRYEDMVNPRELPILFKCPCGQTHKLTFAGRHGAHRNRPLTATDENRAV